MGDLRFLLNDTEISLNEAGASDTLLDFLRTARRLTGTKEGCAEGDCGACTVLLGRPTDDGLIYEPVNACIRFLVSCHGCHVVTVEHLRGPEGGLHPVQQAMVEHHGSQCGFCTPGFVMSLYALWMSNPNPDMAEVETALQGNLCRCTGYEPIVKAAFAASKAGGQAMDMLAREREAVAAKLGQIPRGGVDIARGEDRGFIPEDTDELARLLSEHPKATIVAGATDVGLWVTKQMRPISPAIFVGHLMKEIEHTKDEIRLGAGVTYTELADVMEEEFPGISDYWLRIGGWQVRNMGTIGGNIANASPIGETPPLLIAIGTRIVLRKGTTRRELALEEYFLEYGKQDRAPDEFIETIIIPRRGQDLVTAYKISKRRDSDISAAAVGFRLRIEGGQIAAARVAFGGMAGTPKRAAKAEAALIGQPYEQATFEAAAKAVANDFSPMTDMRASKEYRSMMAGNFFRRFWLEQQGGDMPVRLSRAVSE